MMSYVVEYEVPANARTYQQVKAAIGEVHPDGLLVHLVVTSAGGLRHTEVWESAGQYERFRDERVTPAVEGVLRSVGITDMPPGPQVDQLELIDLQLLPT
jgi:hypothetical protein